MRGSFKHVLHILCLSLPVAGVSYGQDFEAPQQAEYKGPAVLSRGRGSSFPSVFQAVRLRFFAGANTIYTENFRSADGKTRESNSFGSNVNVGLFGTQAWRRKTLTIGYRGGYNQYTDANAFSGAEQDISATFGWQLSPRWSLMVSEVGTVSNRSTSQAFIYNIVPGSFDLVPRDEAYDNRLYMANTGAMLVFRKTSRLSFAFGGDHFIHYRKSILPSTSGMRGRADMSYRMSRSITVGTHYDYTTFRFTRGLGRSGFHTIGIDFSQRLGRDWEYAATIGGARLEATNLLRLAVAPEVSWITGTTTVTEANSGEAYLPNGQVMLSRKFRRGFAMVNVGQGVGPGNGITLTSRVLGLNFLGSFSPTRKLHLSGDASKVSKQGVAGEIGSVKGWDFGGGSSYELGYGMYLTGRVSFYKRTFSELGNRDFIIVAGGVTYSPSEFPLAFW